MAVLHIRRVGDVPPPLRGSFEARRAQQIYDGFVKEVDRDHVGELTIVGEETIRSVKVRLRRASTRLGRPVEIWDQGERVFFRPEPRR